MKNGYTNLDTAVLLLQHRRYDMAKELLEETLARDKGNTLARSTLAACLLDTNEIDNALLEARRTVDLEPNNPDFNFILSKAHLHRGDLEQAKESIFRCLTLNAENADYYALLGAIYYKEKAYQKALSIVDEGLGYQPNHEACLELKGKGNLALSNLDQAAYYFEGLLAQNPDSANTYVYLAELNLKKGEWKKARAFFRNALRINPLLQSAKQGLAEAIKRKFRLYRWSAKFQDWWNELSVMPKTTISLCICICFVVFPLMTFVTCTWGFYSSILMDFTLTFKSYTYYLLTTSQVTTSYWGVTAWLLTALGLFWIV